MLVFGGVLVEVEIAVAQFLADEDVGIRIDVLSLFFISIVDLVYSA